MGLIGDLSCFLGIFFLICLMFLFMCVLFFLVNFWLVCFWVGVWVCLVGGVSYCMVIDVVCGGGRGCIIVGDVVCYLLWWWWWSLRMRIVIFLWCRFGWSCGLWWNKFSKEIELIYWWVGIKLLGGFVKREGGGNGGCEYERDRMVKDWLDCIYFSIYFVWRLFSLRVVKFRLFVVEYSSK